MAVPVARNYPTTNGGNSGKHRFSTRTLIAGAVLGALGAAVPLAHANVILVGPTQIQPAGIGTVSSLLSLKPQGNGTDETASVFWDGSNSQTTAASNTQVTGGNNNTTRTFSEAGVTSAADLRVFLNINEPPPSADILLRGLTFNFYRPDGSIAYSASLAGSPLPLTQVQSGIGQAGYAFRLDDPQAAVLQGMFSPTLRIGVAADIGNASGGFENFFVGFARQVTPPSPGGEVSEPGTLALMGLALGGLALVRRKKPR